MTNKWGGLLLCLVFAGLSTGWAMAQDSDTNAHKDAVRTVSGCLTKSGSGDEYLLSGNDGSTWELHAKSSSVDLAGNVNHTVEAKGVVKHEKMHNMKEDSKNMASDAGVDKNRAEHGHLTVTDLHSISDSCQK